jgi:two-component system response regulator HupR/HoxA
MSKRLMALLLNYSYPGNVRELNNILRAMVALARNGELLDTHLLPEKLLGLAPAAAALDRFIEDSVRKEKMNLQDITDDVTRRVVLVALKHHQWNVRKAAEQLKMTEFGLRKTMKRLGIQKESLS